MALIFRVTHLGNYKQVSHAYNTMQLTISIHMRWFSFIVATGEAIFLFLCILLVYFIAGYNGYFLDRGIGLVFLALLGSFMTFSHRMLGRLNLSTIRLLDRLMRRPYPGLSENNWAIEKRNLKSLQPIKIYLGPWFFVDSKSVLVFWNAVFDKTILLLCAFPLH